MTHFSSYLFFRFIRAFQNFSGMQATDVPSGETRKLELVKEIPWTEGAAGVIKFNGCEYLVQIRPIFSQVEVKGQLRYSDFEKTTGGNP